MAIIITTFVICTVVRIWAYPVYVVFVGSANYTRSAFYDDVVWHPTIVAVIVIAAPTLTQGQTSTIILL
jgi:hypothetical protein